jgi:hypothetical protein
MRIFETGGGEGVAKTVYTHIRKCKNNKIKFKKQNKTKKKNLSENFRGKQNVNFHRLHVCMEISQQIPLICAINTC